MPATACGSPQQARVRSLSGGYGRTVRDRCGPLDAQRSLARLHERQRVAERAASVQPTGANRILGADSRSASSITLRDRGACNQFNCA